MSRGLSAWVNGAVIRLIRATLLLDKAYGVASRLRSYVLVRCLPAATQRGYVEYVHSVTAAYQPRGPGEEQSLFQWERNAVREYLPAPPARVLVGGAGGGREAFCLAARGYDVVAFEPAASLAQRMRVRGMPGVAVYRAGYESLPALCDPETGKPEARLDHLSPFDAALFGWASFSHLQSRAARLRALRVVAQCTRGPILLSFLRRSGEHADANRASWLQRFRGPAADQFRLDVGYVHFFGEAEMRALLEDAGLRVVHLRADGTEYPHAVVEGIRTELPADARGEDRIENEGRAGHAVG